VFGEESGLDSVEPWVDGGRVRGGKRFIERRSRDQMSLEARCVDDMVASQQGELVEERDWGTLARGCSRVCGILRRLALRHPVLVDQVAVRVRMRWVERAAGRDRVSTDCGHERPLAQCAVAEDLVGSCHGVQQLPLESRGTARIDTVLLSAPMQAAEDLRTKGLTGT